MKKKQLLAIALFMSASMVLAGCSSTVVSNTEQYFSLMSTRLSNWGNKAESEDTAAETEEEDDAEDHLSSPANFVINSDGSFSFDEVESADYYVISLYDNASESTDYMAISDTISGTGTGTVTGNLSDYFEFGLADLRVEVVAYPALTDKEYRQSKASSCEYLNSGEVAEPEFEWRWDYFSGTLSVELINIEAYEYTAYPEIVTFTLTNQNDSSDAYIFTLEDANLDAYGEEVYYTSVSEITTDTSYSLTAVGNWREDAVTNNEITVDVGTIDISSEKNAISERYGYINEDVYMSFDYPTVAENFSLTEGGDAGTWANMSSGYSPFGSTHLSFGTDDAHYTATVATTEAGAAYTYDIVVQLEEGKMETSWSGEADSMTGTLNLYEDGTLTLELDYYLVGINEISGGRQELVGSKISGTWLDNGDGTVTLSYDYSSIELTD